LFFELGFDDMEHMPEDDRQFFDYKMFLMVFEELERFKTLSWKG
jgi:hypothetical protein